ncbi:MAG: FG-GAP and VCBS repeat-containing protein [Thermodesulfobacteriota bacterium]
MRVYRATKLWRKGIAPLLLATALFLAASPAHATVLETTFGGTDTYSSASWQVGCTPWIFGCLFRTEVAMQFSFTGLASANYYLNTVALALQQLTVDPQVVVHITTDNGGVPGTILETKTITAPSSAGVITAVFTGTTVLSENTNYWIWLSCPTGQVQQTWMKNDQSITGTMAQSVNAGTAWTPQVDSLAAFRVEGTSTSTATVVDLANGDQDLTVYGKTSNDQMTHDGAVLTGDINGDGTPDLILGSPYADGQAGGRANSGEVYVYYGNWTLTGIMDIAGTSGYTPDIVVYGAASGDNLSLGKAIAVGDVNGDGVDDLIIGAQNAAGPSSRTASGAAYVIYGTKQPVYLITDPARSPISYDLNAGDADVVIYGATASDHLTIDGAVGAADVNGDGIKDIVLGAKDADGPAEGRASCGEAYVIFGSASLSASYDLNSGTQNVIIYGAATGDELTKDGAIAFGDFNRSGVTDLVVGTSLADPNGYTSAGAAYVIYGSSGISSSYDLNSGAEDVTIQGAGVGDLLTEGNAMRLGDVDGDGIVDLVLGASGATSANGAGSGEAYIIYGSASPSATYNLSTGAEDVTILGGAAGDNLTLNGALALGDVNNDGIEDMLLGAPNAAGTNGAASGLAYVIYGSGSLSASYDLSAGAEDVLIEGAAANELLTNNGAVLLADVSGDGLLDICLGATDATSPNGSASGEAYVIFGSGSLNPGYDLNLGQENVLVYGAGANDKLTSGGALAAGDINEDGVADLILGAEFADGPSNARSACGEAYVWYGGGPPASATVKATDHSGNPLGKNYAPARAKVDFTSGATASTTTVLLNRSKAGINLDLNHTANMYWYITTNRTSFAADVVFHYLPSEVTGMREDWLTVYQCSTLGGSWSQNVTSSVDTEANTVRITGATLGIYYALYEHDPTVECFVKSILKSPWLRPLFK